MYLSTFRMFYVDPPDKDDEDEDGIEKSIAEIHQSAQKLVYSISSGEGHNNNNLSDIKSKSSTIKSHYETPPETPELALDDREEEEESPDISEINKDDAIDTTDNAIIVDTPVPPPRQKKHLQKMRNLKIQRSGSNISTEDDSHQNDILFQTESPLKNKDDFLKGTIQVLTNTTVGLKWKSRWAIYDQNLCKIRLYKSNAEEELVGDIDILSATFNYDLDGSNTGIFKIW